MTYVDASEIGFAPGSWPHFAVIQGVRVLKVKDVFESDEFLGCLYVGLEMQATKFLVVND